MLHKIKDIKICISFCAQYNNNNIQRRNSRFLQTLHLTASCLQQVCSSGQGAIVFKSHATHRALITCNMQGRKCSGVTFDRVEIASTLALSYWLNHELIKEERKPEYPQKTPDELQKMSHTKARKFKPQPRLEPVL